MKKGCLIAVVIIGLFLFAGIAGVGYLAKKMGGMAKEFQTTLAEMRQESDRLNAAYPFEEPAAIALTVPQVENLIAIRQELDQAASETAFFQKVKQFENQKDSGEKPGFKDVMTFFSSIASSMKQISQAWMTILDQHQVSPREYHYVSSVILSVIADELNQGRLKEEISTEMSRGLRRMILQAEEERTDLYQIYNAVQNLDEATHAQLVETIRPCLDKINQFEETLYFDAFLTNVQMNFSKEQ